MPLETTGYDEWIWNNPNLSDKINEKEDIHLVVREDVIVLVFKSLFIYISFLLLLIGRVLISGLDPIWISLYGFIMWFMVSILILVFIVIFHNYYLSMQIITNLRVIDIDQTGIFKREVNTVPVENIQDVTFKKNTFFKSVLNFGDVIIQTSGNAPTEAQGGVLGAVFNNVPRPNEIKQLLLEIKEVSENVKAREIADLHAESLRKLLSGAVLGS